MDKPIVFISHISEEREIAAALKKLVEDSFIGMMDVFVSSDPASIHLGQQWLKQISFALKQCAVEIVLVSPTSVRRQWINFEAGAGWIRDVPVIPLCHSGMTPAKLPAPLNTLQAATATDLHQLELIFPVLADALGSAKPQVDFSGFIATVKLFEETTSQSVTISEAMVIPESAGLAQHERVTLQEAAEHLDSPDGTLGVYWLKEAVEKRGFRRLAVMLALKILERKSLIQLFQETDFNGNVAAMLRVTDEGWLWLELNKDELELKRPSKIDDFNDSPF